MLFKNTARKIGMAVLVALTLFVAGGIAISQSISLPGVATINFYTDRIQIVPNGQPTAQSVYVAPSQILASSYTIKLPVGVAFNYTYDNWQTDFVFNPGGTLLNGYLTFAASPSDGAKECFFSTQAITHLVLAANTGQTLNNAVTTLAANARNCYTYSTSNLTWDRSQ